MPDPGPSGNARQVHLVELTALPDVRYSVTLGYLQAAAQADPWLARACDFRRHVHHQQASRFEAVCDQVLSEMDDPLVAAFTVYFWNRAQSLELARRVKERWPGCWVIVGGNDVTHQTEAVFAEAPHVDVLVHGEGELRFRDLLQRVLVAAGEPVPAGLSAVGALPADLRPGDLGDVPGISYRSGSGADRTLVTTRPAERIADLDDVVSPLLSPVYPDADLAASQIIVYETNRGCPYSCAFCYWGGATNAKVRQFPMPRIEAELERIVRTAKQGATLFIADANFGLLARDSQIAQFIVDACARHRKRLLVMTNWAKNTTERVLHIAELLHSAGLTGAITLSAQSFDQDVLDIAKRSNIRVENYRRLQAQFRERGIPTYTDLIWGLPGESRRSYQDGIEEVLAAGGSPVVYPLLLLNNTEFTHERFRTDHGLRSRRLPADVGNPELEADVVVEHSGMTFEDWLWGMELRIPLGLFQKALMRCTLRYLHHVTGVRQVDLLEQLRQYLTQSCSDPVVRSAVRNFTVAWRDPQRFDRAGLERELGAWSIPEEMHYQAALHRVLTDPGRLRGFLTEALEYLTARLDDRPRPDPEALAGTLSVDLAGAAVFLTGIRRSPQQAEFTVRRDVFEVLREAGCVPLRPEPVDGPFVHGLLRVAPSRAHYPFSAYALSVWHGSGNPLRDGIIELRSASTAVLQAG